MVLRIKGLTDEETRNDFQHRRTPHLAVQNAPSAGGRYFRLRDHDPQVIYLLPWQPRFELGMQPQREESLANSRRWPTLLLGRLIAGMWEKRKSM